MTYLHLCSSSTNLNVLLGETIDLKCDDLLILCSFSRIEGEGHILGLARLNDTCLECMVEVVGRSVETVNTDNNKNNGLLVKYSPKKITSVTINYY